MSEKSSAVVSTDGMNDDKNINNDVISTTSSDDDSGTCGYGKCKPGCLQRCSTPGMLLFALCTYALVESFVQWGLVNICLTTWERRYQMSSGQSVWIVTAKDIISIFCTPVFGYMASSWHKGRLLTAGAICMLIGNFMFLVPQFATGVYELGASQGQDSCNLADNITYDACEEDITDTGLSIWLSVFICAQVFFVVTSTALWTVGITYVDDNCKYEDTALYMGILNSMGALGATLGFIIGGLSLEIYVDVGKVNVEDLDIDSGDPRWVGAWWIGYFGALIFTIIPLVLIPCFPREVPAAIRWRHEKKSQAYKGRGEGDTGYRIGHLSDIGHSLKVIFSNPVFDLVTLAGVLEIGAVTAFAAFLPKIIQFQFGQTTSMAALVAGAVLIPGSVVGQLIGGIIPKCAGLGFKGILWMQVIGAYICVITSLAFLAKCTAAPLAGYNADYTFNSSFTYNDELIHECNALCNCTTLVFEPICGNDGLSYFSPCHGACATEVELDDGTKMFGNCSCMPNATLPMFQAEEGMCPVDCAQFWFFMPMLLIMIICTFMESTGGYATIMRVVPEKQKAFAFGVQGPIAKLLGTVPIPILFGFIFDKSCDVWQDNCGTRGSCWIYDTNALSLGMFLAGAIAKLMSGTLFLIAVLVYKPPPEEIIAVKEVDDGHEQSPDDIVVTYGVDAKKLEIMENSFEFTDDGKIGKDEGENNLAFRGDRSRSSSTSTDGPLEVTKL